MRRRVQQAAVTTARALTLLGLCAATSAHAEDLCGLSPTMSISAETRVERDVVPDGDPPQWSGVFQQWSPWSFTLEGPQLARLRFRFMGQELLDHSRVVMIDPGPHEAVYQLSRCEGSPGSGEVRLYLAGATLDGRDLRAEIAREASRGRGWEPSVWLRYEHGELARVLAFGAVSRLPHPNGGPLIDNPIWMAARPTTTPLNSSSERFRVQARLAVTETPAQRQAREAEAKKSAEQRAREQAQRDAEARKLQEARARAEEERRTAAEQARATAAAARRSFQVRFEEEARADFEEPPAPIECSPLAKIANPARARA
jgi:hypothetical protein